ncbi:MAG: transcription antitermination factor NusB [Eubacteriales bacterium]|nr:transcription antitermination factor NusB [Eubacteriales bacterium]
MARSVARQAAMQLLYEQMSGGEADDESLDLVYEQLAMGQQGVGRQPNKDERLYIEDVIKGVEEHKGELDQMISEHSSGDWSLSRVPHVDLSILRLSAYELFYRSDVPDNVAISEAMELADKYSEPKSSRYINGVLGAIGREKQKD